jgi:hypothetical protein
MTTEATASRLSLAKAEPFDIVFPQAEYGAGKAWRQSETGQECAFEPFAHNLKGELSGRASFLFFSLVTL